MLLKLVSLLATLIIMESHLAVEEAYESDSDVELNEDERESLEHLQSQLIARVSRGLGGDISPTLIAGDVNKLKNVVEFY